MTNTNNITRLIAVSLLAASLAACGHNSGDRALSGAGIGAGVGAAGTVLTGGCVACGAVIGGAAGAATGALTNEGQINLGRPVWK